MYRYNEVRAILKDSLISAGVEESITVEEALLSLPPNQVMVRNQFKISEWGRQVSAMLKLDIIKNKQVWIAGPLAPIWGIEQKGIRYFIYYEPNRTAEVADNIAFNLTYEEAWNLKKILDEGFLTQFGLS